MGNRKPLLGGLMAAGGLAGLYNWMGRPVMYNWGATDEEVNAELPGDELVQPGAVRTTRGITVAAPPAAIWPWLAQIGEDRGGFYSYDWLERLVGTRIHNADTVHREWQQVKVGDTVWLARRYGRNGRQVVAAVEPESHLVLMSPADFERVQRGEKAIASWAFYLRPQNGTTRLLARGTGGVAGMAFFDIPHFVMERGMLRGLRKRATVVR
ncbi:MAG: hypothetical protein CK431_21090 [Mycobacterium sp.]|nr:MAG: hypothetical protein CK431_21090 [Mycobacterium sp.]